MRRFVFYHQSTGVLHGQTLMLDVHDLDNCLKLNTPAEHVALEHHSAHPATHRFDLDSQQLVEAIAPPPSAEHGWNAARRRWELKQEVLDARRATEARTTSLLDEQRRVVVGYLLGRGGTDRLREIEDELQKLQGPQGVTPSG